MRQLDPQQLEAVHTEAKRALVLAGAGSGKTRVLIERIGYLIEETGTSPYEIMAFTFTRKAAGEIRDRLVDRIGNRAYRITMGTMHAIALQMIQRFGEVIGLKSKQVTVYGEWESEFLLKEVAIELAVRRGNIWKIKKGDIDKMFNAYYQTGIEPGPEHPAHDLFRAFFARCRENNALTYGALLVGLRLLIPTLKQHSKIRHILVDEVQDIDALQWAIINEMCAAFGASLFVVGDIDQSIYDWRGAVPEYLVEHQAEFTLYRLETNYRSVPEIVYASNKLIACNVDRIPKEMVAVRENGNVASIASITIQENCNSELLADFFKSYGVSSTQNIAILSRIHGLLQKLDRLLTEAEIPHEYIGKDTALTNSEPFRRFHAFLKLLVNPFDNFSFLLIKDVIGISREEYSNIRIFAAKDGISHFQAWTVYGEETTYMEFFKGPNETKLLLTTQTFLIKYMATGALPYGGNGWGFDVEPVFRFIFAWLSENPKGTIQEYLDWLATYDIQDEIKAEESPLTLLTIHAAKGLEWPVVILAGCNEGIIPSKQALKNGGIEAERRLMYVAMTRAREQLILTIRPEVTETEGRVYESPRSRFIGEAVGV